MSSEQESRDFIRGMQTAGTFLENPFPSLAELNGQQFARANREDRGGLAIVMLAIPVLAAMLGLAIISIPSAIVLLLICIALNPASRMNFWDAFMAAGFALCGIIAVGALLLGVLTLAAGDQSPSSLGFQLVWGMSYIGEWILKKGATQFVSTTVPPISAFVVTLAAVCVPLLGVVSLILKWRLPDEFGGSGRWPRVLAAASLFTVLAPSAIAGFLLVYPQDYSPGEALGRFSTYYFVGYSALVTAVGAAVFGFLASRFLAPIIVPTGEGQTSRPFRAYFWAVGTSTCLAFGCFYLFRGADESGAAIAGALASVPNTASFWNGFPGLLKVVFPGVLVGTVVVGLGRYSPNRFRTFALAVAVLAPYLTAISVLSLGVSLKLTLFGF